MAEGFYGESLAKFEAFEKARNYPEFLFAVLNPAGEIAGWYKMVKGCPEWFEPIGVRQEVLNEIARENTAHFERVWRLAES